MKKRTVRSVVTNPLLKKVFRVRIPKTDGSKTFVCGLFGDQVFGQELLVGAQGPTPATMATGHKIVQNTEAALLFQSLEGGPHYWTQHQAILFFEANRANPRMDGCKETGANASKLRGNGYATLFNTGPGVFTEIRACDKKGGFKVRTRRMSEEYKLLASSETIIVVLG